MECQLSEFSVNLEGALLGLHICVLGMFVLVNSICLGALNGHVEKIIGKPQTNTGL